MTEIVAATTDDTESVIDLEGRSFVEDSGVDERYANVHWPRRHGVEDLHDLLSVRTVSPSSPETSTARSAS